MLYSMYQIMIFISLIKSINTSFQCDTENKLLCLWHWSVTMTAWRWPTSWKFSKMRWRPLVEACSLWPRKRNILSGQTSKRAKLVQQNQDINHELFKLMRAITEQLKVEEFTIRRVWMVHKDFQYNSYMIRREQLYLINHSILWDSNKNAYWANKCHNEKNLDQNVNRRICKWHSLSDLEVPMAMHTKCLLSVMIPKLARVKSSSPTSYRGSV